MTLRATLGLGPWESVQRFDVDSLHPAPVENTRGVRHVHGVRGVGGVGGGAVATAA
jgi:hypothetical protein